MMRRHFAVSLFLSLTEKFLTKYDNINLIFCSDKFLQIYKCREGFLSEIIFSFVMKIEPFGTNSDLDQLIFSIRNVHSDFLFDLSLIHQLKI